MDCRTFRNRLEDYLEGGLDFAGRFGMERHAQQCFTCGKTVADAQELSQMTREFRRVTAPSDFEAAVLRRIQAENAGRGFWRSLRFWYWGFDRPSWRVLLAGTSSVALVALGLFLAFRSGINARQQDMPSLVASESAAIPASQTKLGSGAAIVNPSGMPQVSERQPSEPLSLSQAGFKPAYSTEENLPVESIGTDNADYVECLVPGSGDRMMVVRLPKTIRMRYGQPSEQYFIRSVSH